MTLICVSNFYSVTIAATITFLLYVHQYTCFFRKFKTDCWVLPKKWNPRWSNKRLGWNIWRMCQVSRTRRLTMFLFLMMMMIIIIVILRIIFHELCLRGAMFGILWERWGISIDQSCLHGHLNTCFSMWEIILLKLQLGKSNRHILVIWIIWSNWILQLVSKHSPCVWNLWNRRSNTLLKIYFIRSWKQMTSKQWSNPSKIFVDLLLSLFPSPVWINVRKFDGYDF